MSPRRPGKLQPTIDPPGASLARRALHEAASHPEPSATSLLEAIPSILAEAERRQRAARSASAAPAGGVFRAGRAWLPRLAAVTALLVLAALILPARTARHAAALGTGMAASSSASQATSTSASPAVSDDSSLESWIVTGSSSSPVSDPVLDALVR